MWCDSGRIVDSNGPIDFSELLRRTVSERLATHDRREHDATGKKRAAVAIVLVDSNAERHDGDPLLAEDIDMGIVPGDARGLDGRMVGVAGGAAFLLCRRASRMNRHAGQWALPGGRLDPG